MTPLESLRKQLVRDRCFLNYAGTAPLPASTAHRMREIVAQARRPYSEHWTDWFGVIERTRHSVAAAIGAEDDEITFTSNTSTALSTVAGAVRWRPGDRVLFPAREFPSNRYVWENLAGFGVVAEALAPSSGRTFEDELRSRSLERVRLVAVSAVSYRDGARADLRALAGICSANDILLAVDAAQAVGAVPVDVRAWGCDFLACGGHKWLLGPTGSGFLYVSGRVVEDVHVPTVGWASSRHVGETDRALTFCPGARRFEAGMPDVAAIAGLGHSVDLMAAVGWEAVHAQVARHGRRLREDLESLGFAVQARREAEGSGIVTVRLPDPAQSPQIAELLRKHRIEATVRGAELRISAHGMTRDEEVDTALGFLSRLPRSGPRTLAAGTAGETRPCASASLPDKREGRAWRLALVTGASRGLGAAIATALARCGCDLLLVGRDTNALDETAQQIRQSFGVGVECATCDLADRSCLSENLPQWQRREVDVLVNNAAVAEPQSCLAQDERLLDAALNVNFTAPAALTRALLPGMLRRGHGAILNVLTAGARCGLPLLGSYSASKAALWAWTESLRRELHGTPITVTILVPPHMDSTLARHLGRLMIGRFRRTPAAPAQSPFAVAESAVAAMAAGRSVVAPRATRSLLAANMLAPAGVDA